METQILIVDDEHKNIELLEALLGPEGYKLVKAESGEDAILFLSSEVPDLVLLDVMMPGISGFTLLEEIRKNEKTKTLPVILLTALRDREDRIKGIVAGADDFISKPFDKAELVFKVRTQVRLSALRRQINEKEKLLSVMELVLEGTALTDDAFNIQQINLKAIEMLGMKDTSGNLANFLLDKYGHEIDKKMDRGSFIIGRAETTSAPPLFLSGEYRMVNKPGGEKNSYVFVFKDVTEEHTRNKMKTDFLSLISHKLRTPLTVITGYAKMLDAFAPDQKFKDMVQAIVRSSVTLENLIKRILFFVEIDNTAKTGAEIPLDIRGMMDLYSGIYKKPFELMLNQDEINVPYWQKTAIEEIIENAFKFNDKPLLALDVRAGQESVVVEDNGPGISAEEREKVFGTFYQVYRNASGNTPGVGLGLSIVKKLVESSGMSITLEKGKNGGLRTVILKK